MMKATAVELSDYERERGKPLPSLNHGIVQANIGFELKTRYGAQFRFMSEINIQVADRVMVPDIGIFPTMAMDMQHDEIVMSVLPLTTIEILSGNQSPNELVARAHAYFAAGVKSCWIVSPKMRNVAVYSAPGASKLYQHGQTLTDPATGIELPLGPLFE